MSKDAETDRNPLVTAAESVAEKAVEPVAKAAEAVKHAGQRFAEMQASSGLLLIGAGALALLVNNSPLSNYYEAILSAHITIQVADMGIDKSILHWVNDGLMAVFFFLVGLEVKREFVEGRLSDLTDVILPLVAAVGGMLLPALIYFTVTAGNPDVSAGWAIPTATDIAFALGVLALLGDRVPASLRILLLSLAIFDDLGAISIIAIFFSSDLSALSLLLAAGAFLILVVLNFSGVAQTGGYILIGIALWFFVLKSGVHATLAGVLLAFTIPMRDRAGRSPLRQLEDSLHPWIAYGVMPVFAFANAGVSLSGLSLDDVLDPVTIGIVAGLVVGKQVGILAACFGAVKLGWAKLPEEISWGMVYGVSVLAGVGFTMSLFIGSLAFQDSGLLQSTRIGVLSGSILSACMGYAVLRVALRGRKADKAL